MRDTIKQIIFEEFSKVVKNIESDFRSNYVRKRYNFLLSQLDENMTANIEDLESFFAGAGNEKTKLTYEAAIKFSDMASLKSA